jgi:hypothetical protein
MRRIQADLIKDLEKQGEAIVKAGLLNGDYKGESVEIVREWLHHRGFERLEARAEESLSISRSALRNSWIAIAIAIIAMVFPIIVAWFKIK